MEKLSEYALEYLHLAFQWPNWENLYDELQEYHNE